MFSQEFIDEVKSAIDMVKLASQYTDLKPAGNGIWQGECPNPNHQDDTPSFVVWEKSQSWACMGCHSGKKNTKYKNYGSDCFAFLQWIKGIGWKQAILELAEMAGIEPEKEQYAELYDHQRRLALSYAKNIPTSVYDYLANRGLTKQDIKDFMIGFDGSRITFPLFDRYRKVLGFSKRKYLEKDESSPKYKNSPNNEIFNKSLYLYGLHLLDNDFDEIRITEGAMDVIVPHRYGVRNICATLGTSFTENHVALIKNLGKTPVFCMDGDAAGLKSIKRAVDMLNKAGIYSKILLLPDGVDMADLANSLKENTEEYIQDHAVTYGQMMIQDVINQYEAKVNETKLKLLPEIKDILNNIKNEDEQKVIKDYVSSKMDLKL